MDKKRFLYLVYHNNNFENTYFSTFKDAIASKYISKVARENLIIIAGDEEENPSSIFAKILSEIPVEERKSLGVFIVRMDNFYGTLLTNVWEWLEEINNKKYRS